VVIHSAAARPDEIRRHNLSLVLEHIHRDGALTRAELTQRLQVSRSTVGALVADLIALGLVMETVPSGGQGVGRPSHVIGPRAGGPWVAAVDVDITRVATAAVGLGGQVLARTSVEIDAECFTPEDLVRIVGTSVSQVAAAAGRSETPAALGVSIPGTVDSDSGRVDVAPNLGWHDVELVLRLGAVISPGLPVLVGNDADLAVLAEHRRGSARGCSDVVFVMGRVGIGAGIIVNGLPAGGYHGFAGEIGHNVIDETGPLCHCGKSGCAEIYVGEPALLALAGYDGPPTGEATASVFAAARRGDAQALAAARAIADPLGRTMAMVVNMLNPQLVLLGGYLSELFDIAGPEIEAALARYALEAAERTVQLRQPTFGADASLLGAAEIAFARLLADPLSALPSAG
jgi:predicted NBD/HSP70 family sugar kinase